MSKKIILCLTILFSLLALHDLLLEPQKSLPLQQPNQRTIPTPQDTRPRVTRVIDGDTIIVLIDGVSEKVRLIGVDTPETLDQRKPVQCFGLEASAFTKIILNDAVVRLESDPSQNNRDRYGRLLRYVFLINDINKQEIFINKKIIAEGYGHEYTHRIPYHYRDDFKTAERTARENKTGLWADGVCN